MAVLVLDKSKRPLMPCTPKRARKLLAAGRARIHRLFPFCIRLVDRSIKQSAIQPLRLSLDTGSKTTGLAIRMTGNFNIQSGLTGAPAVQGISHKYCRVLQRADGFGYAWQNTFKQASGKAATASRSAPFLTALKDGVSRSKI